MPGPPTSSRRTPSAAVVVGLGTAGPVPGAPTTTTGLGDLADTVEGQDAPPAHLALVSDLSDALSEGRRLGVGLLVGVGGAGPADVSVATVDQLPADRSAWPALAPPPPDALAAFDEITAILDGRPAVFLDYDGTLTPIVSDPDAAVIDDADRAVLRRLAAAAPVTVISGRGLADLRAKVGTDGLTLAGSHGYEIEWPSGETFELAAVEDLMPGLDEADRRLREELADRPGIQVERKPFAIAVHTRRAETEDDRRFAATLAAEVGTADDRLRVTGGKEVTELRPDLDWHKGTAVAHVLDLLEHDHVPLFIGDDVTDEDGLAEVRRLGGIGIRVGAPTAVDETWAGWSLADPGAALRFLDRLATSVG